ncbi:MAG: hypothetical protein HRU70_13320 [Phycisphaeraceae bacterium]|nr:MAG: hypothetical protein HRU70_13320 [Phycisphaeraceae bacterium]
MKTLCAAMIVAGLASVASADIYTDSHNDLFDNGFANLDITQVEVTHDATNIYFAITLRGNIDDTTWGKYCIGINTGAPGGDTTNGWGRNVSWNGQTINYWVGTWADDGGNGFGGELRQMTGNNNGSNTLLAATYINGGDGIIGGTATGFVQFISVSRASLGLTGNDAFTFDILTTGNGADPGVDHLSRSDPATGGWGETSVAGEFLRYQIPSPGAAALLGLGGLLAARRRR